MKSIEQTYQKKSQLEHILLRPDSYIGSTEPVTCAAWVVNEAGALVNRDVTYTPGLYKIFDEVLVNAADNKQRDKSMTKMDVVIDAAAGSISIWNNGASIPVVMHAEEHMYVPELIFGHLLTSSNYDDNERKTTGGRNGYGAKLANIFSTRFEVEANDGERALNFKQVFGANMTTRDPPRVTKARAAKSYTRVTFVPDLARFKMTCLDADIVALFKKRVYDMAGVSDRTLKVVLNGAPVPVTTFKDYVAMFQGEASFTYERLGPRWEVAVGVSDGQFRQVSFVNAICTTKGGRHVDAVVALVTAEVAKKASKKAKADVKAHQVKNHMAVYVNCLIENPAFDSQTKDTLTTQPKFFGSEVTMSDGLLKRICNCGLVDRVCAWSKFKEAAELTKSSGVKRVNLRGIPKLEDATLAGGPQSHKCTLVLTEGDSAKTLAISGLSVVGRSTYGVFPLRGKLLNVRDCPQAKVMANAEIQALVDILGLKFGVEYDAVSVKKLRYGAVMIMADQDHDGSHIKGLVINFLHTYWPSLIRVPGFVCEFITPIVKVSRPRVSPLSFYTLPQFVAWTAEHPAGWTAKYYKGLGTSTAAEAKEYFGDIAKHRIPFAHEGEASDAAIVLAFDKSKADDRKTWLLSVEDGTFVDYSVDAMPYSTFVNRELSLFSLADNVRSIPSVVDGLKPSQRKILFGCFKRNLVGEVKVAQLSGYVAEHAAYHHGEQSLNATIVGMAQNFVGSNNVNLLQPIGQFGTRLMGGADAASPRYIFTSLDPLTRLLFHPDDDALLEYLVDDGARIEPRYYVPVLPLVLVNGSSGIGTGWSTAIPSYHPKDIIAVLRAKLSGGEEIPPLLPWFRGFTGSVFAKDDTHIVTSGVATVDADTQTVTVTDLPIGTWTQTFKEMLETASDTVESFENASTDTHVHFVIRLTASATEKVRADPAAVTKMLKLETTFTTSNMHVFDASGKIRKFANAEAIIDAFVPVRMDMYAQRHAHLMRVLSDEVELLTNKARFIDMVISGELTVAQPAAALVAQLQSLGFARLDADFDYLLSIPIRALTAERVEALRNAIAAKTAELEHLRSQTPVTLWLKDLDVLERAFEETLMSVPKPLTLKRVATVKKAPKAKRVARDAKLVE